MSGVPSTAPEGFRYGATSGVTNRVHLVALEHARALCGKLCIPAPPPMYALRWGNLCPECEKSRTNLETT